MGKGPSMNPFTITQFNDYVSKKLNSDANLKNIPLIGEISGVSTSGGHIYFTLKDENSVLRSVVWKNNTQKIDTSLIANGSKIIALGDMSAYARGGNYSFSVKYIESFGEGDLAKEFNRVKALLEKEGLFDKIHKKPLPKMAKCIGVVTSSTGAAIEDIKKIITSKNDFTDILIFPTLVQGIGATASIIRNIELANAVNENERTIDVLIVGRGGGSPEDLAAFNDEGVARSIFASKIPVISAVGHESDFSISDFVADFRAETPTAAADLAAIDTFDLRDKIENKKLELKDSIKYKISTEKNNLKLHKNRLISAINSKIREMRLSVEKSEITLCENNPKNILSKGYSIVIDSSVDKLVSDVNNISFDKTYDIIMSNGSFKAKPISKSEI